MVALSRLHSEICRHTKKHCVLVEDPSVYRPRWLSAGVTSPSLLFILLEHGKPWMVESAIKQHPHLLDMDIAPGWGSPFIFAITRNPDCLSILLKPGIDLNELSSFMPELYHYYDDGPAAPISLAATTGCEVAVDFLLSQAEVDLPNDILHKAVMACPPSHESIRKFRQRGADANFIVNGSTPLHCCLSFYELPYDDIELFFVVKALVEPSCNLSLQDRTARTALHIALDEYLEDIVTYLLEKNAGLSATATLLPNMWSWAANKTWFPKVQAAALAADQPYTRIKGKVIHTTAESKTVEFSVAVTAVHDDSEPICAVIVSATRNGKMLGK